MRTTFYTCADKKYQDFIPLFAHSALFTNKDIDVEIGVDNNEIINSEPIKFIKTMYGDRFSIHQVPFDSIELNSIKYKVCPNIVRFITTPTIKNEYVLLTDVDLITLYPNMNEISLKKMQENNLDYNNIVRPNADRLTGLHFTKWDSYYPLTDLDKYNSLFGADEHFLFKYVSSKTTVDRTKGFNTQDYLIHISPNQKGLFSPYWKPFWAKYRSSNEFIVLYNWITSDRIVNIVKELDLQLLS